jgi:hypothetical protein
MADKNDVSVTDPPEAMPTHMPTIVIYKHPMVADSDVNLFLHIPTQAPGKNGPYDSYDLSGQGRYPATTWCTGQVPDMVKRLPNETWSLGDSGPSIIMAQLQGICTRFGVPTPYTTRTKTLSGKLEPRVHS